MKPHPLYMLRQAISIGLISAALILEPPLQLHLHTTDPRIHDQNA